MLELNVTESVIFSPGLIVVCGGEGSDQDAASKPDFSTLRPFRTSGEKLVISKVLVRICPGLAEPKSMVVLGVSLRGASPTRATERFLLNSAVTVW